MKRKPCSGPFKYKFIAANGDVTVCCLDTHKQLVIGNIAEATLDEIWDSEKAHQIRMAHINGDLSQYPVCQKCANLDSPQMSEEDIENYFKKQGK